MIFFSEQDTIVLADGDSQIAVTLEAAAQAALILLIGVAIIVSNVLVVAALLMGGGGGGDSSSSPSSSQLALDQDPYQLAGDGEHQLLQQQQQQQYHQREPPDAMSYYLLSLAVADLLCGALVVPLSVYPAAVRRWVYGDLACRLEGYLETTLWTATVLTFMWIGVDRYLAIRKPVRYEALQTRTRCQCWMCFSWISAALLCSPPLLGFATPSFHPHAFVCTLDWSAMLPYACTLTALVLGPSLATIGYTYAYVFATMRRVRRAARCPPGSSGGATSQDKEFSTALAENIANPYHLMSFTLIALFWMSWLPLAALRVYEHWAGALDAPLLHFALTWAAVLNSFWKTLVYIAMSPQFRRSLRHLCATLCCCSGRRRQRRRQQQREQQLQQQQQRRYKQSMAAAAAQQQQQQQQQQQMIRN